MADCLYLKEGDACDQCQKGTMHFTGRAWWNYIKSGKVQKKLQDLEIECNNCGHKHLNLSLDEYLSSAESVVTKIDIQLNHNQE